VAAVALVAGAVLAAVLLTSTIREESPSERFEAFLTAWQRGDDQAAATLTDHPAAALSVLRASRRGLDGARLTAVFEKVREVDDGTVGTARLRWSVPRIGDFAYRVSIPLRQIEDGWTVRWQASNVHPQLTDRSRLGTVRDAPERGDILDREGRALVTERAVVDIALEVDKLDDRAAAAAAVAELVGIDAAPLARTATRAPRGRFVPVVTLRRPAFRRVEDRLRRIAGVSIAESQAALAPTKTYARALLGAVAPATAEQVRRSDALRSGDEVGQWGLQARYEQRLAGTSSGRVVLRALIDGHVIETLLRREGRPGRSLRTTLDAYLQGAAEEALGDLERNAALVAVQPSTGDILAAANRPGDSSYDRALLGRYAPGSTFKVISTAALMRDGLVLDETVDCPKNATVGGRSFRNFEGNAQGAVPFREDFAQSCNTAFVSLADRLSPSALSRTARDFGLGRTLRLGVQVADARVPPGKDAVGRAAAMIGQDRILVSPLTMAGVAATVVEGRWRASRLLANDPRRAGPSLPQGEADALRSLMRRVVTSGTGTALAEVPGAAIGKSGTAEYGSGDPPPTHAWFIAARDDIAIAVLVEGGRSGSEVAAPIAARFFTGVDLAKGTR